MTVAKGIRQQAFRQSAAAAFLLQPPGWTRLEPQSVSGDPTPGLEARVHDPLWLLTRQWQFGEFAAEDAGSPVAVHVASTTVPVTDWYPGVDGGAQPLPSGDLLEPSIEREPTSSRGPSLQVRAEAGAELLSLLADAGVDIVLGSPTRTAMLDRFPLALPWNDPFDAAGPGLLATLGGRLPDGEAAAVSAAGVLPGALPDWVVGAPTPADALTALNDWIGWYRSDIAPLPDPASDCWIDERLEYRFGLTVGAAKLQAPAFGGGRVELERRRRGVRHRPVRRSRYRRATEHARDAAAVRRDARRPLLGVRGPAGEPRRAGGPAA